MALESVTYITDLVKTNPGGGDDPAQGDDHIRNIKKGLENSFSAFTGAAMTATESELNILDGCTATTDELNKVDGFTGSTDDLNVAVSGASSASKESAFLTAGLVMAWPASSIPTGWLECDGSAVGRTTYSELFAIIGETYGNGDGSTTFNVPDYRGRFLRGHDASAGVDPDAASRNNRGDGTTGDNVGTKQGDQFKSHKHSYTGHGGTCDPDNSGDSMRTPTSKNTGSSGGNETRPVNTNVKWIIKT